VATELCTPLFLAYLQVERSPLWSDMARMTTFAALFLAVVIVVMYYIFRALRKRSDVSAADAVREEFEKGKDALLLAAQAKKASREADQSAERQASVEEKERELLKENVDPQKVIGQTCPLSGLEMMADQELVIDPMSGQGYHLSSFLQDWPQDADRPKYIYRYPQGTVVKSSELIGQR